jgi:putative ABC transport system permease protein
MMVFKTPLAWLQLVRNKVSSLVAVAGIAFIVILTFMQLGFLDALYSSATQVHHHLQGDLFLVSSQYKALTTSQRFPRTRLYQTLGFYGVKSVNSMNLAFAKLKNTTNGQKYLVYVLSCAPENPVINITEIRQNLDKLKIPDVVLFDRNSRPEFGEIAKKVEQGKTEQIIEIFSVNSLTGHRVRIGGLFSLGSSFGIDGNLIVSDSTFFKIFPNSNKEMITVGAINLKSGVSPQKVLQDLQANLPRDVMIFTRQGFIDFEKQYWANKTPTGFILNLMLSIDSIVGVVIVYQILYTNTSNQLKAYITLKAIGYTSKYLFSIVFQQALILLSLGYIVGFFISFVLYDFAFKATKLPISMSGNNALIVLSSTILICLTSGMLAVNQLRSIEPADVF